MYIGLIASEEDILRSKQSNNYISIDSINVKNIDKSYSTAVKALQCIGMK